MTTVTLRIAVDKAGASENIAAVKQDLRGMGEAGQQGGQQAAQGMGALQGAINGAKAAVASFLAVYAGIQALSGVVRLADEYQGLTDRLRLATGSSGEFLAAQQGVFAVAQQTGTALSAVGGLYVSLANSTRELNLSQSQLQTITQAVSQSFVISGASAAQTDAAIRQLGQGFASGVLRGDEFNSMMENAPALAAALAASLGVTTGQLRAMAAEGQLTSDVLATGLLNQAPQIAAQFDQMGTTVGQAFTRLSNSVLQFVGEANQATGAGAALAAGVTAIANNIDVVARAFGSLAVALATLYGARALGGLAAVFKGVATAIALSAAPVGTFITGATAATAATGAWTIAARVLFLLIGGWPTILAATAAGVFYLATAQSEAEETAELAQAAILRLRQATNDLKPAALSAAEAQLLVVDALLETARAAQETSRGVASAMAAASGSLEDSAFQMALVGQQINARAGDIATLERSAASLRVEIGKARGLDPIASVQDLAVFQLLSGVVDSLTGAFGGLAQETQAAIPPARRYIEVTDGWRQVAGQAERATRSLLEEQEQLTAEMGGPAVSAAIELAQRLRSVDEREQSLRAAYAAGLSSLQDYNAGMQAAAAIRAAAITQYQQLAGAVQSVQSPYQTYLQRIEDERRLLGLSATERARVESQLRAVTNVMSFANQERARGNALTIDEIANLINQERALDASAEATNRAAQAAEEWGRYWEGAADAAYSAFGDFVAGGLRDFESFADSLKNIARQIMSDLISQFARRIIMNLGVNTSGGSFGGSQGGFDLGGMIQGLFGGSNSQQLGLTRINVINGSQTSGGGGMFGGMGGGMMQNGFSAGGMMGAAGGVAMGLQGIRTGNVLQGAAGGAMAGMQIGGPWGALIGGIIGLLGAALHGKPKPDFRVGGATSNVRNPEGSFETVFGRVRAGSRLISWEELQEPIQEFDRAIQDLVLSTGGGTAELDRIRGALSRWSVDLREEAATAENVLGSRFGAVLSTFSEDVREFVGNAGTVEQRVGRLADALTIERIASNANGITDSFDDMAELLTRFRIGNENLADTFARLGVGLEFVDQTMALLEATFSGTRLEAATFAGELIELAGGFDAFASRMQGALTALFSDEERNQFLASQAQQALNASLTGLNISGVGLADIREQLRTQLRQAMEAGNAELTNQILIAANALGAFSTALEALGEDAVNSAAQMTFGGTTLRPRGGDAFGDANGTGGGLGTNIAPTTQLAAGQQTVQVLNSHTGILSQIAANTAVLRDPVAEKSGRDQADAARQTASTMARIEAMIQEAIRAQVQEAAKAIVGANKRGAFA